METLVNTSRSPDTPPSHVNLREITPESGDRRAARLGTPAPEPEQLACPRCDSTNTKFCYYNNYNLSQPRHFCKSCRRYWTRGGTLRNVPVGGGTRKSASSHKRSRATSATEKTSPISIAPSQTQDPVEANPVSVSASTVSGCLVNLNDSVLPETDSLSSWFSGQMGMGSGLLPLNANGLGLGPGLSDGLGVLDWPPMETVSGNGGAAVTGGDTWQMNESAEGDCFPWPDLSISTLGKGLT